jgi:hypothetical protein
MVWADLEHCQTWPAPVERALIVLATARGCGRQELCAGPGTPKPCVSRWQRRFPEAGVDGLLYAADVRRHPVTDRPAAGTARPGMRGSGVMCGEACLGAGERACVSVLLPLSGDFNHLGLVAKAICRCPSRATARSLPRNRRESGKCRIKRFVVQSTVKMIFDPATIGSCWVIVRGMEIAMSTVGCRVCITVALWITAWLGGSTPAKAFYDVTGLGFGSFEVDVWCAPNAPSAKERYTSSESGVFFPEASLGPNLPACNPVTMISGSAPTFMRIVDPKVKMTAGGGDTTGFSGNHLISFVTPTSPIAFGELDLTGRMVNSNTLIFPGPLEASDPGVAFQFEGFDISNPASPVLLDYTGVLVGPFDDPTLILL